MTNIVSPPPIIQNKIENIRKREDDNTRNTITNNKNIDKKLNDIDDKINKGEFIFANFLSSQDKKKQITKIISILLISVLIYLIYIYYIKNSVNGVWINKNYPGHILNINHNPFNGYVKIIAIKDGTRNIIKCKYKNKKLLFNTNKYSPAIHDVYNNVLYWSDGELWARV